MSETPPSSASGPTTATMPVAVYSARGEITVEDRPVPQPGAGQVLVEVGHCGICGSDIHVILEGWGKPGVVEGHEWSGTIVEVGPEVSQWSVGDAVVGGPSPRCGHCKRCLEGQPSQCENRGRSMADEVHVDGAFAGYVVVDQRAMHRIPAGLASRAAALAEPLAVALHGITRGRIGWDDSVMVLGAGPIGALSVAALIARGLGPVTVVEPNPVRQELARRLGATEVLDPADLESFPLWEPDRITHRAVDVVLECSGKKVAMEAGFQQLRRGGRLVMVGAGIEPPTFDPNRMLLNELTVTGSFVYDADGFERALELLADPTFPADELIDPDDVPLDGLLDALHGLAEGRIAAKAMVVPRRSDR
jgi:(R,R)-butanediol dehydrogenase/meso-butanediol dehydrogenase/diacetyl reductase